MRRRNQLVRLYRALSGLTQRAFAERAGIHPVLLAQYELDTVEPGEEHLERCARAAGFTVADGEHLLDQAEERRKPRQRQGAGIDALYGTLAAVYQRLLRLPHPKGVPNGLVDERAEALWAPLKDLAEGERLAFSCAVLCDQSVEAASQDLDRATSLARLAQDVAEQVRGPEGLVKRASAYAAAHTANVVRVTGEVKAARAMLDEAQRLWEAGYDPTGLLDPGRLLHIEGALLRDERRFEEALDRLDQAAAISRSREAVLITKGFSLEAMGDYERAIETLLEAEPLVELKGDRRLRNILHCNLGFNLCHVHRYAEAADLAKQVRDLAIEMGDEIGVLRAVWLEGRVAAGQGRTAEALALLAQACGAFVARDMWADAALALLEEAGLLLEQRRTAEVKELAPQLAKILDSKGVHREALAALRLFQEAVEQEAATAEMARRVLRYLFRARHDEGLRFTEV
ncbi:MAG TPA: helix-turn-helix transcriptional regulator [Thermoanaerobaculia bacterium]